MEKALVAVRQMSTNKQLEQIVLGARFDDELFEMLLLEEERDKLSRVLIETYFPPATRDILVEVAQITAESFEYSRKLVDYLRRRFTIRKRQMRMLPITLSRDQHHSAESYKG